MAFKNVFKFFFNYLKLFLIKVYRKKQSTEAILVVETQHCIHELITRIQMWVRHIQVSRVQPIWSHMHPNFSMVQL